MGYSRGFLRKSSSGKYVGVVKRQDEDGTWRQVTKTFTASRDESERMLVAWRSSLAPAQPDGATPGSSSASDGTTESLSHLLEEAGARSANPSITVEKAVRACLSAELARGAIERSTHDVQVAYAERHLFPDLGMFPIDQLTTRMVQMWVDALCSRVTTGSARIPFSTLNKTCTRAVRQGLIQANPLANAEAPRRMRPTRSYLPDRSVCRLNQALIGEWGDDDPRTLAVRLGLLAGLRVGEVCGLRWCDVHEHATVIRVSSSIGRSSSGCYLKGPKNASSSRQMPVIYQLSACLRRRAESLGGSSALNAKWFVCGEREDFLDPRCLSRRFGDLCEAADVVDDRGKRATFHVLRHTFATRAIYSGVDVRTLADLLGHSNASMTLNVYAASDEAAKRSAVERLGSAFSMA